MRQYSQLEREIQASFEDVMPLTPAQSGRLVQVSVALIEANDIALSNLARILPHDTLQASRCQFIQRLLSAPFMSQSHLYKPMLQHALQKYRADVWHVIIDRTHLPNQDKDLTVISLHYNGRAIPLYWQKVPIGGATAAVYCDMIQEVKSRLPASQSVIFHGDSEFGTARVIRQLKRLGWDFILAIEGKNHLYDPKTDTSQAFQDYDVPKNGTLHIPDMMCFKTHQIAVNAFAFYQPHHSSGKKQRDYRYLVTSLPLDRTTKRFGRRRWGIEPFFEDYKSSGWNIEESLMTSPERFCGLLVLLAICYLWLVTTGRWLSKVGRRGEVDSHRCRHYSLFRLGWDWIIHHVKRSVL
jgi:hypothetical protein